MTWRLVLVILVASPAHAEDACSALFQSASASLEAGRCDLATARRELDHNLSVACVEAAQRGEADESVDRLRPLVRLDTHLACANERFQLAARAACTLKAEKLRGEMARLSRRPELDKETRALCQASIRELERAQREEAARTRRSPEFQRELRWRIGVGVATLALSVGMATAIGLTRDRDDLAWLAGTHLTLAAISTPVCAYLTGASGGRFTGILWLILGIPAAAAAAVAIGYAATSSPTGRVVVGSLASGLSLATAETMIWWNLKR